MKKLKIIIAMATTLASPLAMQAQENLKRAIDEFTTDKSIAGNIKNDVYTESDDSGNGVESFFYSSAFELPSDMGDKLEAVKEAFNKDIRSAYFVQTDIAGTGSSQSLSIPYGKNLDRTVRYGRQSGTNYMIMLVRDSSDSLKRYAYAIEWRTDASNNKLCGSIDRFYGKDPDKKMKNDFVLVNGMNVNDYLIYRRYAPEEDMNELNSILRTLPTNTKSVRIRGKDNIIVDGKKLDIVRVDGSNDIIVNGKWVKIDKNKSTGALTGDSIKTSFDFIQKFGNLRVAYKTAQREGHASDTALNTGIVNKILYLCKTYGSLLSESEAKLCTDALNEMKKASYDNYLTGLLEQAAQFLKK